MSESLCDQVRLRVKVKHSVSVGNINVGASYEQSSSFPDTYFLLHIEVPILLFLNRLFLSLFFFFIAFAVDVSNPEIFYLQFLLLLPLSLFSKTLFITHFVGMYIVFCHFIFTNKVSNLTITFPKSITGSLLRPSPLCGTPFPFQERAGEEEGVNYFRILEDVL